MDVCLRGLKESNKSKFDSYSAARNSVSHSVSHITFRDCHVHIFADNLSRNSCIYSFSSKDGRLYVVFFILEHSQLNELMPDLSFTYTCTWYDKQYSSISVWMIVDPLLVPTGFKKVPRTVSAL